MSGFRQSTDAARATHATFRNHLIDKQLAQEQVLFIIAPSVERHPGRPTRSASNATPRLATPADTSSMRNVPIRSRRNAAAALARRSARVARIAVVRNAGVPSPVPL
jgi:hypothetical protein